ncbi:hypothetical protein BJ973_008835 [Actinoplanes tereljensis]
MGDVEAAQHLGQVDDEQLPSSATATKYSS